MFLYPYGSIQNVVGYPSVDKNIPQPDRHGNSYLSVRQRHPGVEKAQALIKRMKLIRMKFLVRVNNL